MEDRDTKGDLYEYMMGKIATAGQNVRFRTPRHIIRVMVEMVEPMRGTEDEPKTQAGNRSICTSPLLGEALMEYLAVRTDGCLFQASEGTPWDANNVLTRMLNKVLERLEIPRIDLRMLAKFVGKDRTIKQATRSEKRAHSLGLHSFRHTNGTAMDSLGIQLTPGTQWQHCDRQLHAHIHEG